MFRAVHFFLLGIPLIAFCDTKDGENGPIQLDRVHLVQFYWLLFLYPFIVIPVEDSHREKKSWF